MWAYYSMLSGKLQWSLETSINISVGIYSNIFVMWSRLHVAHIPQERSSRASKLRLSSHDLVTMGQIIPVSGTAAEEIVATPHISGARASTSWQ